MAELAVKLPGNVLQEGEGRLLAELSVAEREKAGLLLYKVAETLRDWIKSRSNSKTALQQNFFGTQANYKMALEPYFTVAKLKVSAEL